MPTLKSLYKRRLISQKQYEKRICAYGVKHLGRRCNCSKGAKKKNKVPPGLDPRIIACPACNAFARDKCRKRKYGNKTSGTLNAHFHKARIKAAMGT